jgi:hypothetical protein
MALACPNGNPVTPHVSPTRWCASLQNSPATNPGRPIQ